MWYSLESIRHSFFFSFDNVGEGSRVGNSPHLHYFCRPLCHSRSPSRKGWLALLHIQCLAHSVAHTGGLVSSHPIVNEMSRCIEPTILAVGCRSRCHSGVESKIKDFSSGGPGTEMGWGGGWCHELSHGESQEVHSFLKICMLSRKFPLWNQGFPDPGPQIGAGHQWNENGQCSDFFFLNKA